MKNPAIIEEIEWQLQQGQGTHQAMLAAGYTNPQTLCRYLQRHNRHDLARHFDSYKRTDTAA